MTDWSLVECERLQEYSFERRMNYGKQKDRDARCSVAKEKLSVKNLSYLGETLSFCLTLFASFALDNGEVTTEWCPTQTIKYGSVNVVACSSSM